MARKTTKRKVINQGKTNTLSYKQFARQFNTWRKRMPSVASKILELAELFGIRTKRNRVSKAKKNKKYFDKFVQQYQKEFGSYTSFKKRYSQKRQKLRRPKGMSSNEYAELASNLNTNLEGLFQEIYKLAGRQVAINEYDKLKELDLDINEFRDYSNKLMSKYNSLSTDFEDPDDIF